MYAVPQVIQSFLNKPIIASSRVPAPTSGEIFAWRRGRSDHIDFAVFDLQGGKPKLLDQQTAPQALTEISESG
jgi:hypothetical protein